MYRSEHNFPISNNSSVVVKLPNELSIAGNRHCAVVVVLKIENNEISYFP